MNSQEFKPVWWLSNPHVQTLWAELVRKRVRIPLSMENFHLADGDVLELAWSQKKFARTVILLHGLGGSVNSGYMRGMMHALNAMNFNTVAVHFRGHSKKSKPNGRLYHAGQTDDLAEVIANLSRRESCKEIFAIGFSIGANMLLKYLGERGEQANLHGAVAISTPFCLKATQRCLSRGFSKIYQHFLLMKLKFIVMKRFTSLPANTFDRWAILGARNMKAFDEILTAPLHGFRDAEDYYEQASSLSYLPKVKVPTLIVHAKDDPFLPSNAIDWPSDISHLVKIILSDHGGHVGFITGETLRSSSYWLEEIVPRYLQQLRRKP